MKRDIANKIKSLFDYQKFEENPKLNQLIKDSLKEDALLTDLELDAITGGTNTNKYSVLKGDIYKYGNYTFHVKETYVGVPADTLVLCTTYFNDEFYTERSWRIDLVTAGERVKK